MAIPRSVVKVRTDSDSEQFNYGGHAMNEQLSGSKGVRGEARNYRMLLHPPNAQKRVAAYE